MLEQSIYERALVTWGVAAQKDQTIEECAEVIQAISHFRRGKCSIDEVVGELADVAIMVEQMRIVFGTERFDMIISEKLSALEAKLDAYDESE